MKANDLAQGDFSSVCLPTEQHTRLAALAVCNDSGAVQDQLGECAVTRAQVAGSCYVVVAGTLQPNCDASDWKTEV